MPSNHLILYQSPPSPLDFNLSQHQVFFFSSESGHLIRWPKYWSSASASVLPHFIFLASKINVDSDCSHKIKRCLLPGRIAMTNLDSGLKSRDNTLVMKVHIIKAMVFSSNHVRIWELDHKEDWVPKNWCFWTVVLEKTLESPLGCKIKPINPKGNQPWIFIGRTDAEAKAPILWPPDVKSQLVGKDSDAGKDWGQEEKGMTEDETVGWHHWLNGHQFEQTPGDGKGQGI